jgi:hypothetical protein
MQDLVGRKVNLLERKITTKFGTEHVVYTVDDPSFVGMVKEMYPDVRIFPPGTGGTTDWQPFRTNIYVDKDGIVTEVTNG